MQSSRVCVTGGSGYIGSSLVKKLLLKGHLVHATLRNLGDHSKTAVLKSLPGAETRLFLFEADLYNAQQFEPAIQGCEFVFLVATPMQHKTGSSEYKDTTEAAVAAIRSIMCSCEKSGTVKRVIYTGSVTASSPLKEDGSGFKEFFDESSWTPLDFPYAHAEDSEIGYTSSKTLAEKEILSYNDREEKSNVEVVSLVCGLVGGDTVLRYVPTSVQVIVSPITGLKVFSRLLKFIQGLLGSIPLVHIEDVCEAHVFCMENPSMVGRFICASANVSMKEILDRYKLKYPEHKVFEEVEEIDKMVECRSSKMVDMGFNYGYDTECILDDSLECAKRLGVLKNDNIS